MKRLIVWAACALTAGLMSARDTTRIVGRIVEAAYDNRPIPFAAVRLLAADSTLVAGTTSNADGHFALPAPTADDCVAMISCVGYETARLTADMMAADDTLIVRLRPMTAMLEGITVDGDRTITKDDRKLLLPDKEQRRASTDGLDLLRRIRPPRLTVNQTTGEISLSGGGVVRLCVNGVQVSSVELTAIRPEDIVRIEYHDAPGARYAGADAVVDYITRRKEAGGGIAADSFDALGNGKWASIDHLSAQYNSGLSALSFDMGYMGQRRDYWTRDYDETWRYPDHEVSRREEGLPVRIGGDGVQAHLNYCIAKDARYMLNARLALDCDFVPAKEEGDRKAWLRSSDSPHAIEIYEHTTEHSTSPSLNLYAQRSLSDGQQIIVDVVGTYIHTGSNRVYRESQADNGVSESMSDIAGRKYSLISEGIYERKWSHGRISSGLRHTQAYTANRYKGTAAEETVEMRQAETAIFAEYGTRLGAWGLTGSMTATRMRYAQDSRHIERYALQPAARLTYSPTEHTTLRYSIETRAQMPALSDMSNVVQEIQKGMVRRGNPNLKPFRIVEQQFAAGHNNRFADIDIAVGYRHEHHPIMEQVSLQDGIFVRSYDNQKSFQRLSAEATITVRPWQKHLSLSVTPLIYRYISHGNTYLHTHTISRIKVDADFTYGNWMLSYNTMMGPANTMYGEESLEENNMNIVLLGYKRPKWSAQAGVFNAFVREYSMETRNANALTPFTSRAHCNRNTYFAMKLSFNISYGRQARDYGKRINNEDKDAGIMQGTK